MVFGKCADSNSNKVNQYPKKGMITMNAIATAKALRNGFFESIKEQVGKVKINSYIANLEASNMKLEVDDWHIETDDGFLYGFSIISPENKNYDNCQIETYVSVDGGARSSVESMIELEHLILANFGIVTGKIDLDAVEEEEKDSDD